jgi:archaellin
MNKTVAIASVLVAAALAGMISTSAYASVTGDESATNTEQEIAQQNDGSGESTNNNCALNSIDTTTAATVACPVTSVPTSVPPRG